MRRTVAIALAMLVGACAHTGPGPKLGGDAACRLSVADRDWLAAAPGTWRLVEREAFGLAPGRQPTYVFYDAACLWRSIDGARWSAEKHADMIALPDGKTIPPSVTSFAAPAPDGGAFMVMALPSVWRAGGVAADYGLEKLMFAVFDHEMAHTRQFAAWSPKIDALAAKYGFGDDLDDDVVQTHFAGQADFAASVKREYELLFAAAAAPQIEQAKAQAREALMLIEARRARSYSGDGAKYADLEDIFLTLEGVGQLSGYQWLAHPLGGRLSEAEATRAMRRGDKRWSQSEGLAIMLAVRLLLPDWRSRAFGPNPQTALQLLRAAVA